LRLTQAIGAEAGATVVSMPLTACRCFARRVGLGDSDGDADADADGDELGAGENVRTRAGEVALAEIRADGAAELW
jgi:hypothetical protein